MRKERQFFYWFGMVKRTATQAKQMARNEACWEETQAVLAESETSHTNWNVCFTELS